jgi:malate dehydrogenase
MKITIIGAAGNIGSSAAFNIATHNIFDEMVLVDNFSHDKLEQYVFDLDGAVTGLNITVRAGDYHDMRDSDLVLIAAGSANIVASRMEVLQPNLPLVQDFAKKILQYCPDAIVIIATNPVCPLNYALYLASGLDRHKLIGYSYNDSIRFRAFVARALGVKSSRVEATVIGEHGDSQVLLFSSVKVDGKPYVVSEAFKQMIRQQVKDLPFGMEEQRRKTGRTAAWTTSMGLMSVCRAIARNSGDTIPCSQVLDGEWGCHKISMSVPVILGKLGVHEILEWKLAPDEQYLLEASIAALNPAMRSAEDFIAGKTNHTDVNL